MEQRIFERFRDIIYEKSGISLNEKKVALVSSRIAKRMRTLGFEEHRQYLEHVLADTSGEEIVQLLDVISTNVTHFFREAEHFDLVAQEVNACLSKGQRRFRFWSAGCSSGEEPYTLAMTLKEVCNGNSVDLKILATDISTRILSRCIQGRYEKRKLEQVPTLLRDKYFVKNGRGDDAVFEVSASLKNMVVFKRLNLSVVPFPMHGPMDAIFCRNVMIYFDNDVRKRLLEEFYRLLKPGGYLYVGHAESLTGMLSGFRSVKPSVYVKGK